MILPINRLGPLYLKEKKIKINFSNNFQFLFFYKKNLNLILYLYFVTIQIQSGVFDIDECHFSLCTGIKMDKGKVFGLFYSFYWSIRGIFKDGFQFGFAAKKMEKVKSNYIPILLRKSGL